MKIPAQLLDPSIDANSRLSDLKFWKQKLVDAERGDGLDRSKLVSQIDDAIRTVETQKRAAEEAPKKHFEQVTAHWKSGFDMRGNPIPHPDWIEDVSKDGVLCSLCHRRIEALMWAFHPRSAHQDRPEIYQEIVAARKEQERRDYQEMQAREDWAMRERQKEARKQEEILKQRAAGNLPPEGSKDFRWTRNASLRKL